MIRLSRKNQGSNKRRGQGMRGCVHSVSRDLNEARCHGEPPLFTVLLGRGRRGRARAAPLPRLFPAQLWRIVLGPRLWNSRARAVRWQGLYKYQCVSRHLDVKKQQQQQQREGRASGRSWLEGMRYKTLLKVVPL